MSSIEHGGADMSSAVQADIEASNTPVANFENTKTAVLEMPNLAGQETTEEKSNMVVAPEKAVEKEKPMTAHERWKERWEAKYSKMVPELVPIVIAAIAIAMPELHELHSSVFQDRIIDTGLKFWTENLLIAGPALAALVIDRLIRRKARSDEQKALAVDAEDGIEDVVDDTKEDIVADQSHLEQAILDTQAQIDQYRTEQAQQTDPHLEIVYNNHILDATRKLSEYQTKLDQLNGVEEYQEAEAA